MIPIRITLDLTEAQMLLEMFAIIEEQHQLGRDMQKLYANLKRQIPTA